MLRKLSIKNFRLLRDVTIDVTPGKPIVLIGPNASGKSSVLQTLDLLSRWTKDGFVEGCKAFGGQLALVTAGEAIRGQHAQIEVVAEEWIPSLNYHTGDRLRYGMAFSHDIETEDLVLLDGRHPTLSQLASRKGKKLWLHPNARDAPDDLEIDSAVLSFEGVRHVKRYPYLQTLVATLQTIQIYDGFLTAPTWLRDPRESQLSPFNSTLVSPVSRLDRRGLELANALHYIQQDDGDAWDELMYAFRAEFPFVQRLEFPADRAGGRIALAFRDKRYPGERMQGHQMSEGMATYLCLLAAIFAPEPAAALAFDEPDRDLHPSALRRIVHLLEKASERSAVFVATHSDRFLDYLADPAGSIRICEPTPEGMKLRSLEADVLEEWRKLYSISTLREQGHLDPVNAEEIDA